ncbi:MAG: urea ABC transporter permease subunit UrtB [Rhodospirillales bacterium]|nr:urea ABC transporter permease subunit UrtB [Rhodospirillales bacterium]MCY4002332.1 urea ABC transporter permease subunit UrtB [Rhodospirillales bacterium]MYE19923.1 urea ABC transporter permease subunit UrtB [Rhodospirillales bacterium]
MPTRGFALPSLAAVLACIAFAVTVTGGAPASHAATLEEAVQGLSAKSYKDRAVGVEILAATGHPRAIPILEAMAKGQLFVRKADGVTVIGHKTGKVYSLTNALDGSAVGDARKKELKKVKVNNRLRGVIKAALGGLTLLSDDPDRREEAAAAVFAARDAGALETVEQAIAREEDPGLLDQLTLAKAAIQTNPDFPLDVRLAAVERLSESALPEVRSLLASLSQEGEPDAEVRATAAEALDAVERDLAFWNLLGAIFQGLSLGSVLLLAAVGLAITFGVMGVINMAHGELVMLGAYTTFVVQQLFRDFAPGGLDYSLAVAVPAAFLVAGAAGVAIERSVIRWLYGRPFETLLATWGLSLILQQLVRTVFGPTNREVSSPSWLSGAFETATGLVLPYNRVAIIIFSLLVVAGIALVLRRTALGLYMRAVTQNRSMASSMGIRTGWVDAATFGLGAGIAGVAGVALSQIDNVSPNLGQAYIVDSFMVVVFGGVGNLWGTLVGAMSLGVINKFLEPFAGAVLAKILVLVAIILFIQKRPRGLFALKGRAAES